MSEVTVLMCVYNAEQFVKKTVESILRQSFKDYEFIIINDGSNDGTKEILGEFDDKRIKIIEQSNKGLTKSLNNGIRLARSKYIALIDSDDISHIDRLAVQKEFLDNNKDYILVGTQYNLIDTSDRVVIGVKFPEISTSDSLRRHLPKGNPICHSSVMFRRDAVQNEGGYDETIPYAQDYNLWVRLLKKHKIYIIPRLLHSYRVSPSSITSQKREKQIYYALLTQIDAIKSFGSFRDWRYLLSNLCRYAAYRCGAAYLIKRIQSM